MPSAAGDCHVDRTPGPFDILQRLEEIVGAEHVELEDHFKHLVGMIAGLLEAAQDYRMCSIAGGQDAQQREQRLCDMIAALLPTGSAPE